MCSTCGCGHEEKIVIRKPGENGNAIRVKDLNEFTPHSHQTHDHSHAHSHSHAHHHEDLHHNLIHLEQDILMHNNLLAERVRGFLAAKNITAFNLVSSPGSGKTTFLERTIEDLKTSVNFYVIEGDQQTMNDAERIDALKVPVIQINTGKACHLDSEMIWKALNELKPEANSVLMIENVGNLVCPSEFDLGENFRLVIVSTTEGDDKPIKYPDMFAGSHVCIINKIDLLPYVDFDLEKAKEYARRINPELVFFEVSAKTGEGMQKWYDWLLNKIS